MIEVKSDCEHDKFGYIPIEDSSILQKIFDLLVQVEQTQVEDCGSLEFELSLKDSIEHFLYQGYDGALATDHNRHDSDYFSS